MTSLLEIIGAAVVVYGLVLAPLAAAFAVGGMLVVISAALVDLRGER